MAHLSDFHRTCWSAFEDLVPNLTSGLPKANSKKPHMTFQVGIGRADHAAFALVSRIIVTFCLPVLGKQRDKMFGHPNAQKTRLEFYWRAIPVWTISSSSDRDRVKVELNVDDLDNRQDWPLSRWIIEKAKNSAKAVSARLLVLKGTL